MSPTTALSTVAALITAGPDTRCRPTSERATNEDGEPQLRVTKGKTYNTCGGVKEETEPRWLEPVAIDDSTFGLMEGWE